jgi:hypothetical protein
MHNLYTLKTLKSHIKSLTFAPACFGLSWNHPQGARKQHFANLLSYDPVIYICYKIMRFVAVCQFCNIKACLRVCQVNLTVHLTYTQTCGSAHYNNILIYIQGVSGGMCQTSGECSLC